MSGVKRSLSAPSVNGLFLMRSFGGVVGATVALYLLSRVHASFGHRPELIAVAIAVVAIVGGLAFNDRRIQRTLKRVAVDEQFLYVSAYADSREAVIPLSEIIRVTQQHGKTLRPVSIDLRSPSIVGDRIRFQPMAELGWAVHDNTVVDELRKLAHLR